MNRVARKGLVTAMVAGGLLATAGHAQADSAARGGSAGSPGVLSGNEVQVPVDVPVNVCGNTINVIGLLNSATGNACTNTSESAGGSTATGARPARHAGNAADESSGHLLGSLTGSGDRSGAHAAGRTEGSPGALAGNGLRLPVDLPVNLSGNSVDVVGIGNASSGNTAVNGGTPTPAPPVHTPVPAPPNDTVAPAAAPALAHTGADGLASTAGASGALLLGGVLLYRRFRPGRG